VDLASQLTNLSPDVIKNVQESRRETLIGLLLDGRRVHTGGATYSLSIDLQGTLSVKVQADSRIAHLANQKKDVQGRTANAENTGKTSDELVAMWNEEHPDDPVED
jgi:hypothetical protein